MKINDSVTELAGVGKYREKQLKKLGIVKISELLWHAPYRYLDFTNPQKIINVRAGESIVSGKITSSNVQKLFSRKMSLFRARIEDDSGAINAVWFNQPFLANTLVEGTNVVVQGKVVPRKGGLVLQVAQWTQKPTILPIYPLTAKLSNKYLSGLINQAIARTAPIYENLPREVVKDNNLIARQQAFRRLHQPSTIDNVNRARERLAFEELFYVMLYLRQRRARKLRAKAHAIPIPAKQLKRFVGCLPFNLTNDQRSCAWQIIQDLNKSTPMNRILQGDVGSGKTIVAFLGAICVAKAGFRVIWIAPTEVLARQHYQSLSKIKPKELTLGLFTANEKIRPDAMAVIGTHALFFGAKEINMKKVAFVIVDEQHRFGVKQRSYFDKLRSGDFRPHFLSMTATPIPRSLALVMYSDLDISRIKQLPKLRKPITSRIVLPKERNKLYSFIGKQINAGRQAYIVAPAIEVLNVASKELFPSRRKAVKEIYREITKKIFPNYKVGLLHGKLKPAQKEAVMNKFNAGKIQILVSTSIIEVGIDVPNASVMVIEGAEFFGLAQLHQLRGRVGRGRHQSYCFFISENYSESIVKRLEKVAQTNDGYQLAQLDLNQRGPGHLTGIRQSGFPDFRMANLLDFACVMKAQKAVDKIFSRGLNNYPLLDKTVKKFGRNLHLE